MLREEDITIHIKSQGYECKTYTVNLEGTEAVLALFRVVGMLRVFAHVDEWVFCVSLYGSS